MEKFIDEKTIAAISTPFGNGGIGIIKVSGNEVKYISNKFFKKIPKNRNAEYLSFYDENNEILDKGIVIFFEKPNSYTGEDILEFHAHGNQIMLNHLLKKILSCNNVRLSFPGEFTERSYLNNKIDLLQAESIINLINSNSVLEFKLNNKITEGKLSYKINNIVKIIDELKINTEAYINFSYEDINIDIKKINYLLNKIIIKIKNILFFKKESLIIRNGVNVSIIGKPNVGKSSIFNLLINKNKSIITNIPGTTRDIIDDNLYLNNNLNINLFDTTGIHITDNLVENIGIKKTKKIISQSDCILLVIDNNIEIKFDKCNKISSLKNKLNNNYIYNLLLLYKHLKIIIIKNKSDLSNDKINIYNNLFKEKIPLITISAKLNLGIDIIKNYIKSIFNFKYSDNKFILYDRHINLLSKSIYYLEYCNKNNIKDLSIFSENISLAKKTLLSIININFNDNSEKILNDIFSKFCIGK